jgi:hypothetical protein
MSNTNSLDPGPIATVMILDYVLNSNYKSNGYNMGRRRQTLDQVQ